MSLVPAIFGRTGRADTTAAIDDKRLWVVESEFANVLHQGRRDGNTLSAALRDCWDGVDLKPATKSNRLYASYSRWASRGLYETLGGSICLLPTS